MMSGCIRLGEWIVLVTLLGLVAGEYNFTVFEIKSSHENLEMNCSSIGLQLAKVDSQEQWEQAYNTITNYKRRVPDKDIYIGLHYNASLQKFFWSDGQEMGWTKWYFNEPFIADIRPCVIMAVDAYFQFRTVDCNYELFHACSKEIFPTTTPAPPVTKQMSSSYLRQYEMITGLTIGFFVFGFLVTLCILMCWCCFYSNSSPRRRKKNPVKAAIYSASVARANKNTSSPLPTPDFTNPQAVGYDNPMMGQSVLNVDELEPKPGTAPVMPDYASGFDEIPPKPSSASSARSGSDVTSMNDSVPSAKSDTNETFGYM